MQKIFYESSTITEHLQAQTDSYHEYLANLILLTQRYSVKLTPLKKARILAIALHRNDAKLARYLFDYCNLEPADVIMTCKILDARRLYKALDKKTEKIKDDKKLNTHKTQMNNIKALYENLDLSLTKSKIKFLRREYFAKLTEKQVNMFALSIPRGVWRKLIDVLHLRENDIIVPWFIHYVFTGEAPEDSIITKTQLIDQDNIIEISTQFQLPIGYLVKNHKDLLTDKVCEEITKYASLKELIVQYHEISSPIVNMIIINKLVDDNTIDLPYGELIKRLLEIDHPEIKALLMQIANQKLDEYQLTIKPPVVVLGDASGSMEVAIRTSSIIASVLCSVCDAKMHLFRSHDEPINKPPRNVDDVIEMSRSLLAGGGTTPATSLWPYYQNKEKVNTFIIVTDEEEYSSGTDLEHGLFADLYKRYYEEVNRAKLVFISFLPDRRDGRMVADLKNKIHGIEKDIIQFRLSSNRPDLRKLDNILDMMMISDDIYEDQAELLSQIIENNPQVGFGELIDNMHQYKSEKKKSFVVCI